MKSAMKMKTSSQEDSKIAKTSSSAAAAASGGASSWLRLKNPRIVRVSRAFGGKDRHSKVCTVRGLRDRRVRLSVPTAIQLYDLQDRLGLNQPSKVVDWLLSVAKDDIDDLPPLQMPPLSFLARSHGQDADDWEARASFWSGEGQNMKGKSKQVVIESQNNKESFNHHHMMPWDNNSVQVSNLGMSMSHGGFDLLHHHHHNVALPGQILTQPYFPAANLSLEADPRSQFSQFQMLMMSSTAASSHNLLPSSHLYSIAQPARPFQFEFGVSGAQHSQNNCGSEHGDDKNQEEQFQQSSIGTNAKTPMAQSNTKVGVYVLVTKQDKK